MIAGHHVIFGMYGFWLPNDPRGSWSEFVGSWDLFRYGRATTTTQRKSVAGNEHDHAFRLSAKRALKRPAVTMTGVQARAVGRGFAEYVEQASVAVWACAILPDHVHLVVSPPPTTVEQLVIQLKGAATRQLVAEGLHPMEPWRDAGGRLPKCFARGQWKVFLDAEDVGRAIRYVEDNPVKESKRVQVWPFVTKYGGRETRSAARRG